MSALIQDHGVRGVVLPGVFRPLSDTWLLARAACREHLPGGQILELCAGPAFAGLAAARHHGGQLTTVDVSRRAQLNARINGRINGVPTRALRGDLLQPLAGQQFDLIVANPPYVPGPPPPQTGAERGWDAGADGRAVLDRVCSEAPAHLAPGGVLLLVHSEVCDPDATLSAYADADLTADVAASEQGPLGPLLQARRPALEARGLLSTAQQDETVLVLRGRRVAETGAHGHGPIVQVVKAAGGRE
jgi:release factor glutamine methyltransferase